jgi:PAS domain S-box-containing protein
MGVLAVGKVGAGKTFTPEQVGVLEQFAALASLALDNARLYEQSQTELKERRSTETALRASEERFRKIFHASPVAICITSLEEGTLLDANDAYWALSGLDAKTSIGRTAIDLELWDGREDRIHFVDNLIRTRSQYNPNYEFANTSGENKSTIAFYELVQLGEETTILSMFYDVTAQRRVQEALLASEERFRKVFQTNRMAICIVTLEDGRFVDANQAFWELSGLEPGESLGRTSLELGLWNDSSSRQQFVEKLLCERSLQNIEYEFVRSGHDSRSTLAFYELVYLKDEICILAMFYDVTAQKNAQEALRQSEARTRALLDAIPDMIFEISMDGIFLSYIPSSEFEPAVPPEEFLGKHIEDVFPARISAQTAFALNRALESGQLQAFEYGLPPGEEMHFFEARVSAVSGDSALVMVRDITQRKWVETEREKLINELEGKNAELERFTYTVSHDLKSPLITIKGFLGFLERDAASGNLARLKTDIQRISGATDKMQLLLNELLELSRIGRLINPPQHVPFEEIAREAVELVQGRIRAGGIKVSIQGGMRNIHGDRQRLVEALQNLVDNSAKFMGNQREPSIEIGQRENKGGETVFFVHDNGIGIAPEYFDRIFGLFNKLDANSDGTGVGLALVKRIIDVHGGRIWVESELGKWTTFLFTLPGETDA